MGTPVSPVCDTGMFHLIMCSSFDHLNGTTLMTPSLDFSTFYVYILLVRYEDHFDMGRSAAANCLSRCDGCQCGQSAGKNNQEAFN